MSEPSLSEKVKDLEKQQQLDKLRLQEGLDEVKAQITQLPHNNLQTQLTNLQTQLSNTQTQLSSLQARFSTGPEPFATNFQLPVDLSILEHQKQPRPPGPGASLLCQGGFLKNPLPARCPRTARKTQPVQSQLKALLLRQHHVVLRTDGSKAVDEVADTTTVLAADPYQRLLIGQTRPVVFLMGLVSPDQNPDIDATAKSTLQENVIEERADFCRMIHAEAARAGKMVLEEEQSHEACTKNASYFHTKA
ncbi:hypothetical protein WJX77_007843 [Trebouxia sp. C0004]